MNDPMNDALALTLAKALDEKKVVIWISCTGEAMEIVHVGNPPTPDPGDVAEPSLCAYGRNGKYVAVWNVEASDFVVGHRLG